MTIVATPLVLYVVLTGLERSVRVATRKHVRRKQAIGARMGLNLRGTVLPRRNHSHFLIQSSPNKFITSITADHLHTVTLNERDQQELQTTGMITVESDVVDGHSHTVSITI